MAVGGCCGMLAEIFHFEEFWMRKEGGEERVEIGIF